MATRSVMLLSSSTTRMRAAPVGGSFMRSLPCRRHCGSRADCRSVSCELPEKTLCPGCSFPESAFLAPIPSDSTGSFQAPLSPARYKSRQEDLRRAPAPPAPPAADRGGTMFFTYVYRELRRRHRQALLTALGLAVGVALVVAVTAYAGGVSKAQDEVLQSLYGVGTDITVSQQQKLGEGGPQRFGMQPPDQSKQGKKFARDAVTSSPGQQSISTRKLTAISGLDGVDSATG